MTRLAQGSGADGKLVDSPIRLTAGLPRARETFGRAVCGVEKPACSAKNKSPRYDNLNEEWKDE